MKFETLLQFKKYWNSKMSSLFKKDGFVLIKINNSSDKLFEKISSSLGSIQKTANSDEKGITNIIDESQNPTNHSVVSSLEFFPHTDGHYLNGVAELNDGYYKICPPKIILLECIKPAKEGGESFLVDGKQALLSVLKKEPYHLSTLFNTDNFNILHRSSLTTGISIFYKMEKKKYGIRYSYDNELLISKKATEAVESFNDSHLNKIFHKKLSEGDLLIIDNTRVLHGRAEFKGSRYFRRTWIQNEIQSEKLKNIQQEKPTYRSHVRTSLYKDNYFNLFTSIQTNEKKLKTECGILISSEEEEAINELVYTPNK